MLGEKRRSGDSYYLEDGIVKVKIGEGVERVGSRMPPQVLAGGILTGIGVTRGHENVIDLDDERDERARKANIEEAREAVRDAITSNEAAM